MATYVGLLGRQKLHDIQVFSPSFSAYQVAPDCETIDCLVAAEYFITDVTKKVTLLRNRKVNSYRSREPLLRFDGTWKDFGIGRYGKGQQVGMKV